jgi:uncharacterized phage protein gp47/JayE
MAYTIPKLQELIDSAIANIENRLNQTTPPLARAFNRVYAIALSLAGKGLYLFAADRAKQCLAISADEDGLTVLGEEFTVPRKVAEATILVITLPGTNGVIIPATVSFIGDSNGVRYFPDASVTISGGVATITVTAEDLGVIGNLNNGETLQIDTQIAGAETTATVQSTDNTGADQELLETWRSRILFAERTVNGGSNATDNKKWAEEVAGVSRAFPYSGQPFDDPLPTSFPGDRTVYVLADTSIDPDGIPPSSLLDEVRDAINTDPVTGKTRNVLGIVDSTLSVEPIERTVFDVAITGLDVPASIEAQVKSDISDALTDHFVGIFSFIEGVDVAQDQNDIVTKLTVGVVVQDVLEAHSGAVEDVSVQETGGSFFLTRQLIPGELAKLGTITYF